MNAKAKHTPGSSPGPVGEQQLMDYLDGRLSPEQAHEVERLMAESGFLDDAVEGLSGMKDKQRVAGILRELNRNLQVKVRKQRHRKTHLLPGQQTITIIALLAILALVTLAYVIFRMYQG